MPIFQDHKLLFIHIPKNAGRSIEAALLGGAGTPDDGRRSLLNRGATFISRRTRSRFPERYLIGTLDVALAAQHLTYVEMEMLGLLPEEDGFHSFAVLRNPFDRALSSIMHFSSDAWVQEPDPRVRQKQCAARLAHWLERPLSDHNERAHRRTQLAYLRDQHGKLAVDSLLSFETISEDFSALLEACGIKGLKLPFRGRAGRKRGYRDYFNSESRKLVEDAFGEDLDAFGYTF